MNIPFLQYLEIKYRHVALIRPLFKSDQIHKNRKY